MPSNKANYGFRTEIAVRKKNCIDFFLFEVSYNLFNIIVFSDNPIRQDIVQAIYFDIVFLELFQDFVFLDNGIFMRKDEFAYWANSKLYIPLPWHLFLPLSLKALGTSLSAMKNIPCGRTPNDFLAIHREY
ncbi:MAG: hypothetical protein LLF89_02555 [Spirochaetaceae bacterium]|nr:hypothetical protein [Spirochaetaceae bacterium]